MGYTVVMTLRYFISLTHPCILECHALWQRQNEALITKRAVWSLLRSQEGLLEFEGFAILL